MPRSGLPACALLLWACASPAPPEEVTPLPADAGPRVVVAPEPAAPAVGLAAVLPGSGWEPADSGGVTLLAAAALLEQARPELALLGAEAHVRCGRWAFVVTVLAPAETWAVAAGAVAGALSRPPTPEAVGRAREALQASLLLDRANPAWQARLAAARALYGGEGGSPWARPGCGVVEALPLFGDSAVAAAARRLAPVASVAAIGAVAAADTALLRGLFGAPGAGRFPVPSADPRRIYVERNTVTAWVSVAWPFGPDADPEAVRLLGAILEDAVAPGVSRPEVLHVDSEVELHGRGGALVVTAVVAPARAAEVAEALEARGRDLASGDIPASVLERIARRFRGVRLRELAAPEARAERLAIAAARGDAPGAWPPAASLGPEAARDVVARLGAPARAVVGPRPARGAVVP